MSLRPGPLTPPCPSSWGCCSGRCAWCRGAGHRRSHVTPPSSTMTRTAGRGTIWTPPSRTWRRRSSSRGRSATSTFSSTTSRAPTLRTTWTTARRPTQPSSPPSPTESTPRWIPNAASSARCTSLTTRPRASSAQASKRPRRAHASSSSLSASTRCPAAICRRTVAWARWRCTSSVSAVTKTRATSRARSSAASTVRAALVGASSPTPRLKRSPLSSRRSFVQSGGRRLPRASAMSTRRCFEPHRPNSSRAGQLQCGG